MITKKVEEALNKQVGSEAFASSSYLAMASWADQAGLQGTAGFFYAQAEEEREHMMKIVRFINEYGGHAIIPAVKEPVNDFKSIKDAVEKALAHEEDVTQKIYKIVDLTSEVKDHATFNFLQWFVKEQVEEEGLFTNILQMIKYSGDGPVLLVDKAIGAIKDAEGKS